MDIEPEPAPLVFQEPEASAKIASAQDVFGAPLISELPGDVLARVFLWLDTFTLLTAVPAVCSTWRKVRALMTNVTLTLNPYTGRFAPARRPESDGQSAIVFVGTFSLLAWANTFIRHTVVPAVWQAWSKVRSLVLGGPSTEYPRTGGLFSAANPSPYSIEGQHLIASFSQRFAGVTVLDLSDTSKPVWESHRGPKSMGTRLDFVPNLFPNLAFIRLQRCHWVRDDEVLFLASIPNIVGVDVFQVEFIHSEALRGLVDQKPDLKALGWSSFGSDTKAIAAIAQSCTALTSVALTLNVGPPADLSPLGKYRKTLKSLTLGGWGAHVPIFIEPAGLEAMRHLTYLTLVCVRNIVDILKAATASCPRLQTCAVLGSPTVDTLRVVGEARQIPGAHLLRLDKPHILSHAGLMTEGLMKGCAHWDMSFATNSTSEIDAGEMVGGWPQWVLETILKASPYVLQEVAATGDASAVTAFLALGEIPTMDCLKVATTNGFPEVVEVLLQANAGVDGPLAEDGVSALAVATYYGHIDVMRVLLAHGANPRHTSTKVGETPVTIAQTSNDIEAMRLLGLNTDVVQDWRYPTERAMQREVFAHLRRQRSAVVLSEFSGVLSRWFSNQRERWEGVQQNGDLRLVRNDLMHRSISELPESVQEFAVQLEVAVAEVWVSAGDCESGVEVLVISGDTSDVAVACLCALGIKRPAWRWAILDKVDYASMNKFNLDDDGDDEDFDEVAEANSRKIKEATKILAHLSDQFVFTFSDPPVYNCPKLYGGRHTESGCLVAVIVTREHGD